MSSLDSVLLTSTSVLGVLTGASTAWLARSLHRQRNRAHGRATRVIVELVYEDGTRRAVVDREPSGGPDKLNQALEEIRSA